MIDNRIKPNDKFYYEKMLLTIEQMKICENQRNDLKKAVEEYSRLHNEYFSIKDMIDDCKTLEDIKEKFNYYFTEYLFTSFNNFYDESDFLKANMFIHILMNNYCGWCDSIEKNFLNLLLEHIPGTKHYYKYQKFIINYLPQLVLSDKEFFNYEDISYFYSTVFKNINSKENEKRIKILLNLKEK